MTSNIEFEKLTNKKSTLKHTVADLQGLGGSGPPNDLIYH
jgi:hypothetical protein